jgi:hypothetical protein
LANENAFPGDELQEIAARALKFQRYIFKRAWGIYYAVWAGAILAFSLFFPLLDMAGPAFQNLPWYFYAVFYGGIGLGAGLASAWIFKNAIRAANLQRVLKPDKHTRLYYRMIGFWWIAFYIIIGVAFTIYGAHALTLLYAMLLSVAGFVYYQLGLSFPDGIPFEGKLATLSYFVSCIASLLSSLLNQYSAPAEIAWVATVVIWLFCALYSLKSAPEELAALTY